MATGNPVLGVDTFRGLPWAARDGMTIQGTVGKTLLLLLLVMASAGYTWNLSVQPDGMSTLPVLMLVGTIGGLALALVTVFQKRWAGFLAPAYALCEGLVLGGVSAIAEQRFPGVVMPAVGLTFTTMLGMLALYASGVIRATDKFRAGVASATMGIFLFYVIQFALGFFGLHLFAGLASGPIGLAIQVGIVAIAALNLVLDFDFIERGAEQGAPKYMEWYGAFGLLVTLVWLYMEILRLLSRLQERR